MKSLQILSKLSIAAVLFAIISIGLSGCAKNFDQPATTTELGVTANKTIKQLLAIAGPSGSFIPITDTIIITGIISANDKSGNLYKEVYLQDATGAVALELDASGLYTSLPVGREAAVLCKGLWIANVNGMKKVCMRVVANNVPSMAGIPAALINNFMRKGKLNQPINPQVVTISQLNPDLQGVLVKLENFEVIDQELDFLYADTSANKNSLNIDIQNCANPAEKILFRNSGYANFSGFKVPQGNGTVTAIYTIYQSLGGNITKQLLVRDTSDLQMWGIRCDGTNPSTPVVTKPIQEIRNVTPGSAVAPYTAIEGFIVSNTANESAGNYRIQDASGYGIQLRVLTAVNGGWALGTKVKVNVSNLIVDYYNGDLQINNVGRISVTGTGTVTPRVTTVADIGTNLNTWASTVVTLNNVTIAQSSTGTSGINYTVTDATGGVISYVRTTLGYNMPVSASSITGYVGNYNGTPQLTIRVPADLVGGVFPNTLINENFETTTTSADIALTGWQNIPEVGGIKYQGKLFGGTKYAQLSAYNTAQPVVKSWLITPVFSLNNSTGESLSFKTKDGFNNGSLFKVMISTDYDGGATPWTATWTDLSAIISTGTTTGYAPNWISSGIVDISTYNGTNVYIAFKYEGGDPGMTTTYQLDDVVVIGN